MPPRLKRSSFRRRRAFVWPALIGLSLLPPPASGRSDDPADLCRTAAASAARETGVPLQVLLAISLTETGHRAADGTFAPWPWTLNQGGESQWFDSRDQVLSQLKQSLDQGVTNIDIGCFQLNWRWHGAAFDSLEQMITPEANARYAATLLARHYDRTGDWSQAAGAYHSATPEYAARYIKRFDAIFATLDAGDPVTFAEAPQVTAEDSRTNGFPLLQAGAQGAVGSLVPLAARRTPLIGG